MALADPLISNGEGTWSFWSSAGSSVTPVMATVRAPEPPPEPEPVFYAAPGRQHGPFADSRGYRLGLELLDFNPESNPTGRKGQRLPQLRQRMPIRKPTS